MNPASIAICSEKGGTGKTTLSLNLGLAFAQSGLPAAIVELDPQGGMAASLLKPAGFHPGLADVVQGDTLLESALLPTKTNGLTLLTAGDVEPERVPAYETKLATPGLLRQLLNDIHGKGITIILCDCPAGLGAITAAALSCTSHVLVPVQAEPLAVRNIFRTLRLIEAVKARQNPDLALAGLLLMMFDRDSGASLKATQSIWNSFDETAVLETSIPRRDIYLQASLHGVPAAFMGAGSAPEARRFQMLAQEVLERLVEKEGAADHDRPSQTLL